MKKLRALLLLSALVSPFGLGTAFAQSSLDSFQGQFKTVLGVEEYCGKSVTIERDAHLKENFGYLFTITFEFSNAEASKRELFQIVDEPQWDLGRSVHEVHKFVDGAVISIQTRRAEGSDRSEATLIRKITLASHPEDYESREVYALKIEFAKKERDLGTRRGVVCDYRYVLQ